MEWKIAKRRFYTLNYFSEQKHPIQHTLFVLFSNTYTTLLISMNHVAKMLNIPFMLCYVKFVNIIRKHSNFLLFFISIYHFSLLSVCARFIVHFSRSFWIHWNFQWKILFIMFMESHGMLCYALYAYVVQCRCRLRSCMQKWFIWPFGPFHFSCSRALHFVFISI